MTRAVELLWLGYSGIGLSGLKELTIDRGVPASVRAQAALQLGRWYLAEQEPSRALRWITLSRVASGNLPPQRELPTLEVDTLLALGRRAEARLLIEELLEREPGDPDLLLRLAGAQPRDSSGQATTLDIINEVLTGEGYGPLERRQPAKPLSMDNLAAPGDGSHPSSRPEPTVTVLMPAYNAMATIETAIRSLLAQSWAALEILVIDDASTDETATVVERLRRDDDRVRLIRLPRNQGPYAARNEGLAQANGAYVTVHDADDWAHPQKIETQARALWNDRSLVATISSLVRVQRDLRTVAAWRPMRGLIRRNYSSLMVRRETFAEVGHWDTVRAAGDTEFFERLVATYDETAILHCSPHVPLTFAHRRRGSVTTDSGVGARSMADGLGARRLYREGYEWWHADAAFEMSLPYRPPCDTRPFPLPAVMQSDVSRSVQEVDLLVVADCRRRDVAEELICSLPSLARRGIRSKLLHVPSPRGELTDRIDGGLLRMMADEELAFLARGERTRCRVSIIADPDLTLHLPDQWPVIRPDHVAILAAAPNIRAQTVSEATLEAWRAGVSRVASGPVTWYWADPASRHDHVSPMAAQSDEDHVDSSDRASLGALVRDLAPSRATTHHR